MTSSYPDTLDSAEDRDYEGVQPVELVQSGRNARSRVRTPSRRTTRRTKIVPGLKPRPLPPETTLKRYNNGTHSRAGNGQFPGGDGDHDGLDESASTDNDARVTPTRLGLTAVRFGVCPATTRPSVITNYIVTDVRMDNCTGCATGIRRLPQVAAPSSRRCPGLSI